MDDCTELGNVVKSNETLDPTCKSEVHNKIVFEHLMQYFFDSQNLVSTQLSPTADCVPPDATLLEQLVQDAVNVVAKIHACVCYSSDHRGLGLGRTFTELAKR